MGEELLTALNPERNFIPEMLVDLHQGRLLV
jgi:hypothetical protein